MSKGSLDPTAGTAVSESGEATETVTDTSDKGAAGGGGAGLDPPARYNLCAVRIWLTFHITVVCVKTASGRTPV